MSHNVYYGSLTGFFWGFRTYLQIYCYEILHLQVLHIFSWEIKENQIKNYVRIN